jgi:hypothetical protein
MNNNPFFQTGRYGGQTHMQVNGLGVTLHMPRALKSSFGASSEEVAQALPPYNPRAAFLVDTYPSAPADWLRSSPGTASYMVPVAADHGMWLDLNACASHSHHVAAVISTQGINAITGLKSEIRLEQYGSQCPKHHTRFPGNRHCRQCGYDWPAQNYLTTTTTPNGFLWLDGFRTEDGTTRQWVLTEDVRRSVAAAVIGDDRVHAIGVAFFLSKEPKKRREPMWQYGEAETFGGALGHPKGIRSVRRSGGPALEIAAGAKIRQAVHPDDQHLSFWSETPAGIIVINYTDETTMSRVLAGISPKREGFVGTAGVPYGN